MEGAVQARETRSDRLGDAGAFLLGFFLSDAGLFGQMRPFGLCYAFSLPKDRLLWGCAGAFLGSLAIGRAGNILYAAACIVALAADVYILRDLDHHELWLPAALTASVCVIKLPFALIEGLWQVGLLFLEGAVTFGCSYVLLQAAHTGQKETYRLTVGSLCMAAFAGMKLLGLVTPSVIAAQVLVMTTGWTGDRPDRRGVLFGLALGGFLDMAQSSRPFYAAVFAIGSGAAGLLPIRSRIGYALSHLTAALAALVWGFADPRAMGSIFDCFLAASIFLLLPEGEALSPAEDRPPSRGERQPGSENLRLRALSRAISALSKSAILRTEGAEEEVSVVFDRAVAGLCRSCPQSGICWIEEAMTTFGDLNDLLPKLRRKGHVGPNDLTGSLQTRCSRKSALCAAVNGEYMSWLRRQASRREEARQAELLRAQYDGMSAAVGSAAEGLRQIHIPKPTLEKQISGILPSYRRGLTARVWQRCGQLCVQIGPFDPREHWVDEMPFLRTLEGMTGKRFLSPETVCMGSQVHYLYKERESLRVSMTAAVRSKAGEPVCGDHHMAFDTGEGRFVLLLADGMGAGETASKLARSAVRLIASFIKSGCGLWESARAVVPFLSARSSSGFATLDLLEVDLFTGEARLLKCGGADSYLCENGEIRILPNTALPPGADPAGTSVGPPIDLQLQAGCTLIMASDGALLSADALPDPRDLTAARLMEQFGKDSRDDVTLLVLRIERADKEG